MIQNHVLKAILSRRSVRAYEPDPIPPRILTAILEAGQAAPYIMPDSRHFAVLQDRELIAQMNTAAIAEGSKISDHHRQLFSAPGFDGTYGAPVAIILSGNESTLQYEAVCAASAQNMLVAAQALGIASCWVYFPIFAFHGLEAGMWREKLLIPKGHNPCAAVLLGYGAVSPAEGTDERYKNEISYGDTQKKRKGT